MGPSISEVGTQEWLPHPNLPSLWALRFKLHCSLSLYTRRMNFLCTSPSPPPPALLFRELFAECPIAPREWWALSPQHPELVTWLADPKDSQRTEEGPASWTPESAQCEAHSSLRNRTTKGRAHPVYTAGEMEASRQGRAAGRDSRENDHLNAYQHKRAVEIIRSSMTNVWKKRTCECLGNRDKRYMRRGQKIKRACPLATECSHSSFPSVWSPTGGWVGRGLSLNGWHRLSLSLRCCPFLHCPGPSTECACVLGWGGGVAHVA